MNSNLEVEILPLLLLIEATHSFAHAEGRGDRLLRGGKGRHHRIPNRLHNGSSFGDHTLGQDPKMRLHKVVRREIEKPEWIIDGNFGGTREMRMRAADTIVVLDLPRWLCMLRILKRLAMFYNKKRPDMAEGCNEKIDWEFIMWVWNYRSTSRVRLLKELEPHSDKNVVILKSRREVTEFLDKMRLQYR